MDADTRQHEILALLADIEYAMLTTRSRDGSFNCRPLQTLQIDAHARFWFFTNTSSDKCADIRNDPRVNLAYADPARKIFVAILGQAELVVDRAKINELWTPAQLVFFPRGRDDPTLTLLKITPDSARYWDGNESPVGLLLKFGKAVLRGKPSDLGHSGHLDLDGDD
jgi:general stress protein 26